MTHLAWKIISIHIHTHVYTILNCELYELIAQKTLYTQSTASQSCLSGRQIAICQYTTTEIQFNRCD